MKMPTLEEIEKFKAELAALLQKYNAEIYTHCYSSITDGSTEIILTINDADVYKELDSITSKSLLK